MYYYIAYTLQKLKRKISDLHGESKRTGEKRARLAQDEVKYNVYNII